MSMKERPILFSAPMVRAILAGTKVQTRRALHPDLFISSSGAVVRMKASAVAGVTGITEAHCPYWREPGDRLWVRENGWERPERTPKMMREGADTWEPYYYDADGLHYGEVEEFKCWGFKRRPSIHMPRWASRITLEITGVRVERLQEISEADALAEGITKPVGSQFWHADLRGSSLPGETPQWAYRNLWESINGPGSWGANPWVWVLEFRRVEEQAQGGKP